MKQLDELSPEEDQIIQKIYEDAITKDAAFQSLSNELSHLDALLPDIQKKYISRSTPKIHTFESLLDQHGFLEISLDHPSAYLDTNIHPLFRFENFDQGLGEAITRQVWEAMHPALTLATKFITHHCALSWWYHLMYGSVDTDPETGKRYLAHDPREDDQNTAYAEFGNLLVRLTDHMAFYWRPEELQDGTKASGTFTSDMWSALAEFDRDAVLEIKLRHRYLGDRNPFHGYIGLSTVFLYQLISPYARADQTDCQKMRLQLEIAGNLCHELSHAIYAFRGLPSPEPHMFLSDPMPEIGLSWDFWVFGSKLNLSVKGRSYEIGHMFSSTWNHAYSFPSLTAPVPMHWIQKWFRKDTWDYLEEALSDKAYLWMPETLTRPPFLLADRFYNNHMYKVLYKDDDVVFPSWLKGKITNLPCFGPLEPWYQEVSEREVKMAIAGGRYKEEDFSGPWGVYEQRLLKV